MSRILIPESFEYEELTESLEELGIDYHETSRDSFLDELVSGNYSTVVGDGHENMYAATIEYDSNMNVLDFDDSRLATSFLSGNPDSDARSIQKMADLYDQVEEKEAIADRADFTSSVFTHDAKNELNVILGRLDIVKDQINGEAEEHLNIVQNCSYSLRDIVNSTDSLLLNGDQHENVNLTELIDNVYNNYKQEAEERGFNIEADIQPHLQASAGTDITAMYGQMIRNSFEHSEGDHIRITADRQDGRPRVVYEDNGSGIEDERKQEVLNKGVTQKDGDGGLGMFIIERNAERYNMDLEISDSEDLGGVKISTLLEPAE